MSTERGVDEFKFVERSVISTLNILLDVEGEDTAIVDKQEISSEMRAPELV